LRLNAAGLLHHLLGHRHADGELGRHAAGPATAFALLETLGHLEFDIVVEVAHGCHA